MKRKSGNIGKELEIQTNGGKKPKRQKQQEQLSSSKKMLRSMRNGMSDQDQIQQDQSDSNQTERAKITKEGNKDINDGEDNELIKIELQKLNVVDSDFINSSIAAEANKINRIIASLEKTFISINSSYPPQTFSKLGGLESKVNNLILSMSFLCSKIILQSQKLAISLETTQSISQDYRQALKNSQQQKTKLQEKLKQSNTKIETLRNECDRLRSVCEIYQRKSNELSEICHQNEQVIQQMNFQVEAAEIRANRYLKKYRQMQISLQQALNRLYDFEDGQQLRNQEYRTELKRKQYELQEKDEQVKKWKERCFKQQNQKNS